MGDEHLDTILTTKSDEFIKSSVENLVSNPSESEGEHECDVPACEVFTTFSNILFDADYDFYSSDDQLFSDEDILKKIYSNPLFDEEIISTKIDSHHFNAESDLIESLLNHDSLIISSSLKIDYLFDEFAGELTLLKSIPSGINETDCDPEEKLILLRYCSAKAQYWKPPVCYDDDDEEESSNSLNDNISELPPFSAITPDEPVLSTEEPDNSLSMGDEHLDTIPATESDLFIKSGVENLISIPSAKGCGSPHNMAMLHSKDGQEMYCG
nr:hypothetical protein [Tanacetum cinerariifolium]